MVVVATAPSSLRLRRKFYFGLSLLATLIAFVGFWPTYFGPLLAGTVDRPVIIHFHAAVYVGWLLIFVAQTAFAATGHLALHKKVGSYAISYGVLVIVVGLITTLGMFAIRVRAETPEAFLSIGPLLDMLVFAPFFALAVYNRRRPALHKRLMVVAMTSLLIAAVARMPFLGSPRILLLEYVIWVSPVLLAMAYDFARRRHIHPVYIVGIIVLTLESRVIRQVSNGTDSWLEVNRWLSRAFSL
jgi:hypothetical protein